MNINQIKYVLAVAGSSSMREAAAKLFVSQPALSVSIRELEEELGILIFERNTSTAKRKFRKESLISELR